MTKDATESWNRTEGVLVAPGTAPETVAQFLTVRNVVGRLEWYPSTPHLLSLTLACDVQGRVAVTPTGRGGVVAGPGVSEFTEALAREFHADVTIGPASFNSLPEGVELPAISGSSSPTARTVVVSPLSAYTVPLQATLLERSLAVASAPGMDRRLVMYAGEGQALGTFGWDDDSLPALVLTVDEHDMAVRAITSTEGEDDAVFSWGMSSRYVMGGVADADPSLVAFVKDLLEDRTDASVIAAAVPGADAAEVSKAIQTPGIVGMLALVEALGLPDFVGSVLTGRLAPAEVPGAVVHEPRGLSNAVSRSVGLMLQDPSTPGAGFWRSYVHAVTDNAWIVRAGLALEAGLGGALLGTALRRRGRTGVTPRWLLAGGVLLLLDSVVEASTSSWVRHLELRRRADEEMALVAEELGA
ncbi:hypothetical protein [Actinomyces trachealis]|uniref:hypothetical protein n=1 Tax=Actinomyces trachealis TaxID=2763540 RepID=UPI001892BC4C|nr:hypothetical protein [Actinomyces trachealis]